MFPVRRGMAQAAKLAGITRGCDFLMEIRPRTCLLRYPFSNGSLMVKRMPVRRGRRALHGRFADLSKSTAIPSVCSRYEPLVLIPLTPSYYCPLGTPPPYCLLWLGTQLS